MLAAALVTLIFSVFFWGYGHNDSSSNPEYWVLVKVCACPPLRNSFTTPGQSPAGRWPRLR